MCLKIRNWSLSICGGNCQNKWNIGITQSLPWPGTFGARSSAASALAEAEAQSAMQSRRDLRLKTLQLLADIVGANRRAALLTEIRDNDAELRKHYEKAWQMGETTILDLNKIKIEEINSEGELAAAQADREALLARTCLPGARCRCGCKVRGPYRLSSGDSVAA